MTVKTVLCFGDSNTHGTVPMTTLGDSKRYAFEQRWPSVMAKKLGSNWHVIAEGHPGRTSVHEDPIEGAHKSGARTLLALLESHRPLDCVVIMLGTNDLKSRFNVTAFEIAQGVEKLVAIIRASTSGPNQSAPSVLVVAPPPLKSVGVLMEIFGGGPDKSSNFADAFATMGARANVPVFNAGSACQMSDMEGVHMEPDAHVALGEALADQLNTLHQ